MNTRNDIYFSVITPVFNQAAFIRRAVESLLGQTHKNWELIIVNDSCTDKTEDFIASYLDNPKVKYIRYSHNMGLGYALNQGLDAAAYDHIAYLPADDYFDAGHLEDMAGAFCDNDDNAVVFSGIRFDDSGNISAQQSYVKNRGMGLFYKDIDGLAARLKDKALLKTIAGNVMAERMRLTFDSHTSELTGFFRKVISCHQGK